jgi:hypothetical protein
MMGGANANLQNLIITWANFIYLYNHNMQKLNVSSSIWEKIMANIVTMGDVIGEEKINCNLLIFFLLQQGHLLINFEAVKLLF